MMKMVLLTDANIYYISNTNNKLINKWQTVKIQNGETWYRFILKRLLKKITWYGGNLKFER